MSGAITQDRIADLGPIVTTDADKNAATAYVTRVAHNEYDRAELLAALGLDA